MSQRQLLSTLVVVGLVGLTGFFVTKYTNFMAACAWDEGSVGPSLSLPAIGETTATLNFTDNSIGESGFDIIRNGVVIATIPSTSGGTTGQVYSYNETDLTRNTTYSWSAQATRSGGCIPLSSNTINGTTLSARPLAPTLTAATTQIRVIIKSGDNNPADVEYAVFNETLNQYLTTTGSRQSSEDWATRAEFNGDTGTLDSGLTPNTSYTYKIIARNRIGVKTAFSPPTTIMTLSGGSTTGGTPPPPPGGSNPPNGSVTTSPPGNTPGNNNVPGENGDNPGSIATTEGTDPTTGSPSSSTDDPSTSSTSTNGGNPVCIILFLPLILIDLITLWLMWDTRKRVIHIEHLKNKTSEA